MKAIPWLEAARADLGVTEAPGHENNPSVMTMYAEVGHPNVKSEATSWCAASQGAWLVRCGLPIPPTNVNLLARSYLQYGTACEPKPGAIAVWPRGESWQGHVNTVETVLNDGRVICIGGNQSGPDGDGVTRTAPLAPSTALGFRWPPEAPEVRAKASRKEQLANVQTGALVTTGATTGAVAVAKEVGWLETVAPLLKFAQDNASLFVVGAVVFGLAVSETIKQLSRQDIAEGRYRPSGEQ